MLQTPPGAIITAQNKPIISPDIESEESLDFRLKIVREFRDRARCTLPRPSQNCTLISPYPPKSVPDRKSSRKKGGGIQRSRDARLVERRPLTDEILPNYSP